MVVLVIIILGFLYGSDYFTFYKPYGVKESSLPIGIYIISIKWWNIKFNWYTRKDKWFVDISITIPRSLTKRYYAEHIVIFSSSGIKFWTVYID